VDSVIRPVHEGVATRAEARLLQVNFVKDFGEEPKTAPRSMNN